MKEKTKEYISISPCFCCGHTSGIMKVNNSITFCCFGDKLADMCPVQSERKQGIIHDVNEKGRCLGVECKLDKIDNLEEIDSKSKKIIKKIIEYIVKNNNKITIIYNGGYYIATEIIKEMVDSEKYTVIRDICQDEYLYHFTLKNLN